VRVAGLGAAALLATWLVALALGALGGFEALPSLPGESRGESEQASAGEVPTPAPVTRRDNRDRGVDEEPASGAGSNAPIRPVSRPEPQRAPRSRPAPAPTVGATTGTTATTTTKPGKRLGTTQTTGKPLDSPGNGPPETGPPGQTG
jgi:hypothetical protein